MAVRSVRFFCSALLIVLFVMCMTERAAAATGTPISACGITITVPGNYYVTRNLTGPSGTACIVISANNVTIDLQGNTLTGNGTGYGIFTNCQCILSNAAVVNGTVQNFSHGVFLDSSYSAVVNLLVKNNTGTLSNGNDATGVFVRDYSVVANTTVSGNAKIGIGAGSGTIIFNTHVENNASHGIYPPDVTIEESEVNNNGGLGIFSGGGSVINSTFRGNLAGGITLFNNNNSVVNSVVNQNGGDGIFIGSISGNNNSVINSAVEQNDGNGISIVHGVNTSGSVTANTVRNNTKVGISLVCPAIAIENTVKNNAGGNLITSDNTCLLLGNTAP